MNVSMVCGGGRLFMLAGPIATGTALAACGGGAWYVSGAAVVAVADHTPAPLSDAQGKCFPALVIERNAILITCCMHRERGYHARQQRRDAFFGQYM